LLLAGGDPIVKKMSGRLGGLAALGLLLPGALTVPTAAYPIRAVR
jgi:hypothetical protein